MFPMNVNHIKIIFLAKVWHSFKYSIYNTWFKVCLKKILWIFVYTKASQEILHSPTGHHSSVIPGKLLYAGSCETKH